MEEIKNAKITGGSISMSDHGCLTFSISLDGGCWGICIGNYVIGHGALKSKYWDSSGAGLVCLMKIMDTVGVETWEDLTGKYIRVVSNGWGQTISKIGNILHDKWFDMAEFFENAKSEKFDFILCR